MKNKQIAEIFNRIAVFLEMKDDNVFKIRAYRKAADILDNLSEDVESLAAKSGLDHIPGIGEALKGKILEYLQTGKISAYERLKQEIPESIFEVMEIPSIGPKKAKLFFKELGVKSLDDLKTALSKGRLVGLAGIQEKTIENIKKGIGVAEESHERMNLALADEIAQSFIAPLKKLKEIEKISTAGSLRRQKETVRDIDILVVSSNPVRVMDVFTSLPQVGRVLMKGETKSSVLTKENVQVDLRVVEAKSFGSALLYFTGSKNFNVKLRQLAIRKKMKINEYGLFSVGSAREKFLCGRTEQEMFKKLGLSYLEPELREDIGETEIFSGAKPPKLIEINDIQGDLHVHSIWSDGANTIAELAAAAQKLGYSYLAVSDHSLRLRVAHGLSVAQVKSKKKEIEALNKTLKNFRVLLGTEVEIDAKGNIDYNDKVLCEFDVVIAAIHSGFKQGRGQLTERIIQACKNKYVHGIAHPLGTHIGKREPYDVDLKEICKVCRETNTFLEINAFPIRLDLNSSAVYFAQKENVKFAINTDSHETGQLSFMKYGVSVARRGWLSKDHVINTLSLEKLLKTLEKRN